MAQRKKIDVVAAVPNATAASLRKVVQDLSRAGLKVDSTLDKLGLVLGSVDPEKVEDLRRVEGVSHVRPQEQVRIASE